MADTHVSLSFYMGSTDIGKNHSVVPVMCSFFYFSTSSVSLRQYKSIKSNSIDTEMESS